jgi:hypothetical protein
LGSGAVRTTRPAIRGFLDGGRTTVLDVDGNGTADALTDGILILRYLFAPGGAWNYSDALGGGATRTTRAALKAHLDQFNPAEWLALGGILAEASAVSLVGGEACCGDAPAESLASSPAVAAALASVGDTENDAIGAADIVVESPLQAIADAGTWDAALPQWDREPADDARLARAAAWVDSSTRRSALGLLDDLFGDEDEDWFL